MASASAQWTVSCVRPWSEVPARQCHHRQPPIINCDHLGLYCHLLSFLSSSLLRLLPQSGTTHTLALARVNRDQTGKANKQRMSGRRGRRRLKHSWSSRKQTGNMVYFCQAPPIESHQFHLMPPNCVRKDVSPLTSPLVVSISSYSMPALCAAAAQVM